MEMEYAEEQLRRLRLYDAGEEEESEPKRHCRVNSLPSGVIRERIASAPFLPNLLLGPQTLTMISLYIYTHTHISFFIARAPP